MSDSSTKAQLVWFDSNVNNDENKTYQTMLKDHYQSRLNLTTFDDLRALGVFVSKLEQPAILMVSGSDHQPVFDMCYESRLLTNIIVFAFATGQYDDVKNKYDKVVRVSYDFDGVIKAIQEVINSQRR